MSCSTTTLASSARAAVVCLALAACGGTSAQQATTPGADVAPDFTLRDTSGRTVRLSDHRGEVVLINFWATWCVPCAAELPHLERLYKKYAGRGFTVLAISMDGPESSANVPAHVRRHGLSFPVLLDEETRVVGTYNPKRNAPYTVIIGRGGAIVKTREGYHAGDEVAVESDITAQLDGP